jgi:hypothetical protein
MRLDKISPDRLPTLSPLEYFTVVTVALHDNGFAPYAHVLHRLENIFYRGVSIGDFDSKFHDTMYSLGDRHFIKVPYIFFRPTRKALDLIDPKFSGANAGGPLHRACVWKAALASITGRKYAHPHTGGGNIDMPDVVVFPFLDLDTWALNKGHLVEIELQARTQPNRVVQKFRDAYKLRAPLVLYVPDCDINKAIDSLTEKTKAVIADGVHDLKVGYVAVEGLSKLDQVDSIMEKNGWFIEEPLDEAGFVHPNYPHRSGIESVEDVGYSAYVSERLEVNPDSLEDLREETCENPFVRRELRRRGLMRGEDERTE